MKKLTTAAFLVGGIILACQSAFAQTFAYNNLYLGFWNPSGTASADYIINLGAASNIVAGSSVVDLSTGFSRSTFDAVLGTSASLMGGVVGAANLGSQSSTSDTYGTELRNGGAGNPAVPGSTGNSQAFGYNQDAPVVTALGGLNAPSAGASVTDTNKTWESQVENGTQINGTFWSAAGFNPDSAIGEGGVLYEDLWETATYSSRTNSPWVYLGYFTLDLSGGSPKLTFTPKSAPAPLTAPVIVSVRKTGSTVTLISTNAVATHTYQLQYTTSLNPASWSNVGSSQAAGSTMVTNTDTSATGTTRFYRVMAQ